VVVAGIEVEPAPAVDDHLGALVGGRLEQHRVEVGVRRQAGGLRLQGLGATDLAAVDGDRRIERHVLRLERRDAYAMAVQDAAQRGHQHVLPASEVQPCTIRRRRLGCRSPGGGQCGRR
jgi:hypothetical protein